MVYGHRQTQKKTPTLKNQSPIKLLKLKKFAFRVASSLKLQVTKVASYKLQVTSYKLQVTSYVSFCSYYAVDTY